MSGIDFGRHTDDYANFRPGFPASFYGRLNAIVSIAESDSLDIATGPGIIALELGQLGGNVVGIDISADQIATATRLAEELNLTDRVRFNVATAEETGLESNSIDLATAGQCWHWFDSKAAMDEMQRILRPGGFLAIAHYSYLAEHSPAAKATEELVLSFNPSWTMSGSSGMYPERIEELLHAGFELVEQFCYHHDEEFTHERWRGRMRTCAGVGSGGLPPEEVERFDRELAALLGERYPSPMVIDHRVWCVVAKKPD